MRCLLVAAVCLLPQAAHAQYRNKLIGFDFSYMALTKPTTMDSLGNTLLPGNRGNRISQGLRLGGEWNFKLHRDHWWISTRFNFMQMMFRRPGFADSNAAAETNAAQFLGFNFGIEGLLGVRYYWLTDRFRPYLQVGLGYMHIFSFGAGASQACDATNGNLCNGANDNSDALMPRTNIMPLHVTPGFEFVLKRDVALHLIIDYSRWVVFRGKGNNVLTVGLGVNFYG